MPIAFSETTSLLRPLMMMLTLAGALLCSCAAAAVRDYGGWYTKERIENLRANCDKFDWARQQRDGAINAARRYITLSDEQIWSLVPGQKLPRAIDVSMNVVDGVRVRPGCPVCGHDIDKHGNYPYNPDILGKPWKLTCPSCQSVFPTNDFGAYYASGIDEAGVFDPEKADRSLLFNAEHPDPDDPLHDYGVDDGYGYFDKDGNRYLFIAYFNWKQWSYIRAILTALANAYLFTGEQVYAHKGLILLDRIADVYPDYDIRPYQKMNYYHSGGGNGKVEGNIWETGVVTGFARAADTLLSGTRDDPELYQFLAHKGQQFKLPGEKGTRELLIQNIDDGILREGATAVLSGAARGNQGMHQRAITACAMALDQDPETEQWLDWLFEPEGGGLPGVIVGGIDRDGVGAEAAPGYALSWGLNIGSVADWLADYPGYTKNDIYRDFPQFKATFAAGWNIGMLGYATPNVGDTGSTGSIGLVGASGATIVRGYRYLGDPLIALAAYYANGQSAEGLGRDIHDADPERISRETAGLAATVERNPFEGGHNMAGYGLASIEYGWGRNGTGLWMYYGRNGGHGHLDRLNIDLFYRGLCMMPDLGYPEFATSWPKRNYFTNNTISHNTVIVDQVPQSVNWVGHPELFCQFEDFGAARVDSREVYPGVERYQRTVAFIKLTEGQGYVFDLFRIRGGNDHLYVLHGPPGEVTREGLELTAQEGGSYAGEDVPFKTETPRGAGYGTSWLTNVERAGAAEHYVVDWKAEEGYRGVTAQDDIHLRYHALSPVDDVALADGEPPQNKPGNPKLLRYLLAHRAEENLSSSFAGIIEPYSETPAIASVQRLAVSGAPEEAQAVAVKVTLADGAVDYLVSSADDQALVSAEGGPTFCGGIGWLRVRDGQVERAALSRGARLELGAFSLSLPAAGYTGHVARMDKDMEGKGYISVDCPLPGGDTLRGQQIIIDNDRQRNAVYTIQGVEADGELTKVCLGDVCFVRGYADPKDYSAGYVYNFEEGAGFIIPHAVHVSRRGEHTYAVQATGEVELGVKSR